jgi:retron-type reverse transcriptase
MKIYRNLYNQIISPENLFEAWDIFKSDKRNKPDVQAFEKNSEQEIFKLSGELRSKNYRHGSYRGFWVRDPKMRHIHKAIVRDRVLHHAIFKILYPIFEPTFISASFSCRVGKGTHKGVAYVAQAFRAVSKNATGPCYALKCDVRKFFDSIDQDILLGILKKKIRDPDTIRLLENLINSYVVGANERERERERVLSRREKAYLSATSRVSFSPMCI